MYQMTKIMGMFVFFAKHTKADAQSFTCHGSELSQNPVPQQQEKSLPLVILGISFSVTALLI